MRRLPLRVRVTLAFAAGTATVLLVLGIVLHLRFGTDLLNGIDQDLRSRAQVVISGIERQDPSIVRAGGNLIDPDEAFAQVLTASGQIVDSSAGVAEAALLPAHQLRTVRRPEFFTTRVAGVDDPVRLLAVPMDGTGEALVVVVGSTLGDRNEALGRLTLLLAFVGPVALIVVSTGGWLLAGAALRPIERMRREAAAISVSELDRRLPVPAADDELSRLGVTLNSMLDRLEQSYRSQARFVDQASHELRTPLGVLKAELDLALARSRTSEELEAALRNASSETDRLVRLSEDLLVLARAADGRLPVRRMEVSVRTLLSQIRTAYEARAASMGRTIAVTASNASLALDPSRVRQAVESLLDNALRHGGGAVELSSTASGPNADASGGEGREGMERTHHAEAMDEEVHIVVRDHGPGFPEDVLLSQPPEPFRRSARPPALDTDQPDRAPDGAGLGLATAQAIAHAHGGYLRLENDPGGGARATLVLRGPARPAGRRPGGVDFLGAVG